MDIKPELRLAAHDVSAATARLEKIASRFPPHSDKRITYLAYSTKLNDTWHELMRLLAAED